jgi:hypothetical protein
MRAHRKLKRDDLGMTLLFSFMLAAAVAWDHIAVIIKIATVDRGFLFHVHWELPTLVAIFFFGICCSLGVTMCWMDVVRKAQYIGIRGLYTKSTVLGVAAFGAVVLSCVAVFAWNPMVMTVICTVIIALVGVSFRIAGDKVYDMLLPPGANPEAALTQSRARAVRFATHIRDTARLAGGCCMAIGLCLVSLALLRPSPTPLFRQQNNEDRWHQGQVPYVLFLLCCTAASSTLARYIRFWASPMVTPPPAPGLAAYCLWFWAARRVCPSGFPVSPLDEPADGASDNISENVDEHSSAENSSETDDEWVPDV